ncbi:hypothetical protein BGW80DRAFT_1462175 [Lactifluus volemus]|nr:hypothetical protein BGW80DRAFT_1462175 [Lactifluus volemus]
MQILYTRFTTVTGRLAPLLGEFEIGAHSHPEELGALLSECHGAYFGARKNPLVSRQTEQIRGLDPTRTELVELTRRHREAGTLYFDYLYGDLRPRILHEPRLTVLCEVCTVLQALMVLDQSLDDEIEENQEMLKDEPEGGDGGGGADQTGVADMLSSVLSRTSTLLPGSLFASLVGTRAEHLADARRGIDQDLKHACESVISAASEPLRTPLRAFTGRPTSAAEAFRNACASDLRASIARVRLYVPDVRTAGVLVQHRLDLVEDAYSAFSLAARQVGPRAGKGKDCLMDDGLLNQLLQDIREDGGGSPPART